MHAQTLSREILSQFFLRIAFCAPYTTPYILPKHWYFPIKVSGNPNGEADRSAEVATKVY